MKIAELDKIKLHYRIDGNPDGKPVLFANSLGTDLRLWDAVLPLLPQDNCYIRYDKRGHGLSECTPAPYSMGTLVRDVEQLMDHLNVKDALFVGLSIGGMIAQGLAVKRLDLVRAMVLSNTAAKSDSPRCGSNASRQSAQAALHRCLMQSWSVGLVANSMPSQTW